MPDPFTKETRSKIMSSIRSRSKLEDRVTHALWHRGLRFRKNVRNLIGSPDIAVKKYKVVIFIDSCFWHGCPDHYQIPKTNTEFWVEKIKRNKARDEEVTLHYETSGWQILRVWEHQLKDDFQTTLQHIGDFIKESARPRQVTDSHDTK